MQEQIPLKTWSYSDNKKITLFTGTEGTVAKIIKSDGEIEATLSAADMNIPSEIIKNSEVLSAYVKNTYVRVAERSDGSFGLYINQQMQGGGVLDGLVSIVAIGGGAALVFYTGGTAAKVLGSGLVNAGINGLGVSTQPNNDMNKFLQQVGTGFLSGIIVGAAGQIVSGINGASEAVHAVEKIANFGSNMGRISTNTATMLVKMGTAAIGGALAEAVSSKMRDGKIDIDKVLFGAIIGAVAGFAASGNSQTIANLSPEQAEAVKYALVNTIISQGAEKVLIPGVRKKHSKTIQEAEEKVEKVSQERDLHIQEKEAKKKEIGLLTHKVDQLINKNKELQEEIDACEKLKDEKIRKGLPPTPPASPVPPDSPSPVGDSPAPNPVKHDQKPPVPKPVRRYQKLPTKNNTAPGVGKPAQVKPQPDQKPEPDNQKINGDMDDELPSKLTFP